MIDMKLIPESSPMLLQPSEEFDLANPPFDPKEFAESLYNTMARHDGLGLSAVQVGYPYRVFAMRNDKDPIVLFNPRIVFQSSNILPMKEGCLSFPGIYVNIKRPKAIKARWQNSSGEWQESEFSGYDCKCFLHELDHLEGIVFQDRVSTLKWALAVKKSKPKKRK